MLLCDNAKLYNVLNCLYDLDLSDHPALVSVGASKRLNKLYELWSNDLAVAWFDSNKSTPCVQIAHSLRLKSLSQVIMAMRF